MQQGSGFPIKNEVLPNTNLAMRSLFGNGVVEGDLTMENLIPKFIDYVIFDRGFSQETARTYRSCLNAVCGALPHIRSPQQITAAEITELKKRLKTRNPPCGERRINGILNSLKSFLKFCREVKKVPTVESSEIKLMKEPRKEVVYLTVDEIKKVRDVLRPVGIRSFRMRAILEVLLSTGLRISEALSLKQTDVDWQNREAVVVGKGNRQRIVYFTEESLRWLKAYLQQRRDDNPALFVTFGSARKLARSDLSKSFKFYRNRAGLKKKFTPHILRHTMATTLLHHGCDTRNIQLMLGHANISTTAKYYLGTDKKALKAAHEKYLNFNLT